MNTGLPKHPLYQKLAYVLICLLAIGYIVVHGKQLLSPFIFSCLFSILLLPVCRFFERKFHFPRSAAAMVSVALLLAAVAGVFYLLGTQLSNLADDWPLFKQQLTSSAGDLQVWISHQFHINTAKQQGYVNDAKAKLMTSGTSVVGTTLLSVSSMALFLVFTFIYTVFFLLYRKLILTFFVRVFGPEHGALVHEIVEQVQFIMRKYIIGLLIEMSIIMVFVSAVFSIIGIKYALLLGLITGLLNIIPYIGIYSAAVLSAIITMATGGSPSMAFAVAGILIFTHLIDANVLLPLVVGSKVRINAMVTVLGVVTGEMIWGIPGMFLSIPVIAVLKIIFDRVESLKPWGLILGDVEKKDQRFGRKFSRNKKPSLEKKLINEPEKPAG